MSKNPWKKLNTKIVHKNPWFQIRKDDVIRPDGEKGSYSFMETGGPSVFIVPITPENEIYMIGLHRYPTDMYSLEIPAGNSDGEAPLLAAKRELQEETGFKAESWENIGQFQVMNGVCSEMGHIYLARDLVQTEDNSQKEEGIREMKKVPSTKIPSFIQSGKINDGQSIIALTKAFLHLGMPLE